MPPSTMKNQSAWDGSQSDDTGGWGDDSSTAEVTDSGTQWGDDTEQTPAEWGDDTSETGDWGGEAPTEPSWGEQAPTPEQGPAWGDQTDTPAHETSWGDPPADPAQEAAWGADAGHAPEPPAAQTPSWDDLPADQNEPDQYGVTPPQGPPVPSATFDDYDDGYGEYDEPAPNRTLKLLIIGIVAVAVLVVAGIFLLPKFIGPSASEPDPTPPPPPMDTVEPEEDETPTLPESSPFDPFVEQLEQALNARDPEAYHALLSEESQEHLDLEAAEEVIDALPPGAQYEVVLRDGSEAGDTATVKLTLIRTLAGDVTEQDMVSALTKEGPDWRMVVKVSES